GDMYSNVTSWVDDFGAGLEKYLNSTDRWVFPGGSTFTFKKATFSDREDLVTHIKYADPS
ncbi:MAG: hypothetical protein AAFP19_10015, partial [Bacteroidota bacterium]